jgi:hypothetical protein
MKNEFIGFIYGTLAGTIISYGGLFIVNKIIANNERAKHDALINKIRTVFTNTSSEPYVGKYIDIINNARQLFPNDYANIMKQLDALLDSNIESTVSEKAVSTIESFIVALDILHIHRNVNAETRNTNNEHSETVPIE